jgi:hypothetical protein
MFSDAKSLAINEANRTIYKQNRESIKVSTIEQISQCEDKEHRA